MKKRIKEKIEEKVNLHQLSAPTVIAQSRHDWKQEGPNLICHSCESLHGIYIGNDKIFKGYSEEGNMIIDNKYEKK